MNDVTTEIQDSTYVRAFNALTPEEGPAAGGKGATLAFLYQAGYPVPPGFVILSTAFAGDTLPAEAWVEVRAHLRALRKRGNGGSVAFAVRSSALSEDSASSSFGGQFETVLGVRNDAEIWRAVDTVRGSATNERVRAYSRAKGLDTAHQIAVVVQELVDAEISGVLFTADPITGSHSPMQGTFVHGLGEALVSGEASGATFSLRDDGRLWRRVRYHGAPDLEPHATALYKLGRRLEQDLGSPQDIEWCIAQGKLYLLQSRPITTLRECDPLTQDWNSSLTGDYLWLQQEPFPEVITPATWSLWQQTYLATPVEGISSLGNIGGRVYLNVSVPYSVLRKMGQDRDAALATLEGVLGPVPQEIEVPRALLSLGGLMRSMLPTAVKSARQQRSLKRRYEEMVATSPARCRELEQQIEGTQDGARLVALWHDEVLPRFQEFALLQDAYQEEQRAAYKELTKTLTRLMGETEADALLSTLSSGSTELASLGPILDLDKVESSEMGREEYISRYGHRHANENELRQARPGEDPNWMEDRLAEYRGNPIPAASLLEKRSAEFQAAWTRFEQSHPRQAGTLHAQVAAFGLAVHRREAARSEWTRAIGVARRFFLHASSMLLEDADDAFFLTCQELLDLLAGVDTASRALSYLPARRATYNRYAALPPYPAWIRGRFDPVQWAGDLDRRKDIHDASTPLPRLSTSGAIQGLAGSAGRVEGLARILEDPQQGEQLRAGEILVAVTTNIGWTPLFPRAAAVVTDIGAPLAHAAIVARELGIPAVVGCRNATARIRTGDRVRVDGSRGIVEILSEAEPR